MGRIERWSDCVSEGASSGLDGAMRPSDGRKSCSQPILTPDLVNVDPPDYFTHSGLPRAALLTSTYRGGHTRALKT